MKRLTVGTLVILLASFVLSAAPASASLDQQVIRGALMRTAKGAVQIITVLLAQRKEKPEHPSPTIVNPCSLNPDACTKPKPKPKPEK